MLTSTDSTDLSNIIKSGDLSAQETKVFQSAVAADMAMEVSLTSNAARRRRGTSQDYSDLKVLMNAGAVTKVDDFKLTSRSDSGDGGSAKLVVGNSGADSAKPVFIGIKNDGWYGNSDFAVNMSIVPCTNCTGVVCGANMECVEATGK